MLITHWYRSKDYIPDGFLQILIDLYIKMGICNDEFMLLLDEKLKRNEIYE